MTDSGTFQSYVYGDVEEVEEIIQFQKDIGVDIATMFDVFTRSGYDLQSSQGGC